MGKKTEGIGTRIRDIRKRAGLTQGVLGERLGVTASSVSSYESGEYTPSPDCLVAIAKIGGVSLDWLLTGQGEIRTGVINETLESYAPTKIDEESEEWRRSRALPSEFEMNILDMLRSIGTKERRRIVRFIQNAYQDEIDESNTPV